MKLLVLTLTLSMLLSACVFRNGGGLMTDNVIHNPAQPNCITYIYPNKTIKEECK